jgi:hypothetical protein
VISPNVSTLAVLGVIAEGRAFIVHLAIYEEILAGFT